MSELRLPEAPNSIQKGVPLKLVLDQAAVNQLAENLHIVYPAFKKADFANNAMKDIEPLSITQRAEQIAESMRKYLPQNYAEAIEIILRSLTPPLEKTEDNGLAVMFYMPHSQFVAKYGVDSAHNNGEDPFELSMKAQYELTQRFTSEFSIRAYIINNEERTMERLYQWMSDENPHVRRLCSEGTRPRLPWAMRIPSFIKDPSPVLPILETLKNDPELYVRRSVANHLGDIAKDHQQLVLGICERWLPEASKELKWVIRHALRHPAKKGVEEALRIRLAAK